MNLFGVEILISKAETVALPPGPELQVLRVEADHLTAALELLGLVQTINHPGPRASALPGSQHSSRSPARGDSGAGPADTRRWEGGRGNKGSEMKVTGRDRRLRFLITENTSQA